MASPVRRARAEKTNKRDERARAQGKKSFELISRHRINIQTEKKRLAPYTPKAKAKRKASLL